MTAKEFFRQVQVAESELKVINAKLRHYEDIGLSISPGIGSVGGGQGPVSRVEIAAVGAVDALADLGRQRQAYMMTIAKAERIIQQIQQEKYRKVLSYRYLCGWSFRSISDELGYNDQNSIYRAHGWALIAAQAVLEREQD